MIKLPPVTVKSMTNLTIDWSAVTQDFLGHKLDAVNDLNTAALLMWALPLAELETKLNADTLSQIDLNTPVPPSWPPDGNTMGKTSAQVYDFKVNGSAQPRGRLHSTSTRPSIPPAGTRTWPPSPTGNALGQGFGCCKRSSSIPGLRRRRSR